MLVVFVIFEEKNNIFEASQYICGLIYLIPRLILYLFKCKIDSAQNKGVMVN